MKKFEERKIDFSNAYSAAETNYRKCSEDVKFLVVNGAQWEQSSRRIKTNLFKNKPKPEINKLFRSVNRVIGQMQGLELQAIISSASDEAQDKDAELLQGRWRNDFAVSDGIEAQNNADFEAGTGGFGAFKLAAKYEDEYDPDQDKQYLCVEPIYDAYNSVYFNAGAIRKDKADAVQCWEVFGANRKLIEDEYGVSEISSFDSGNNVTGSNQGVSDTGLDITLAHYWEVITKKVQLFTFEIDGEPLVIETGDGKGKDEYGNEYSREDIKLLKDMHEYTQRPRRKRYVEYTLMSGSEDLVKVQRIPFERVPVIPRYGYHHVIDGMEIFYGEVRHQRDGQVMENMTVSALMQIQAGNHVEIPEYTPTQIQKYAAQRAAAKEENPAFLMLDVDKTVQGQPIIGRVGTIAPATASSGLQQVIAYTDQANKETAGTGQSTLPSNVSATAVQQINDRQDQSYMQLIQNKEQSLRALCKAWIPAAQSLYFTNSRKIRVQGEDGNYSQVTTMQEDYSPDGQSYGMYKNSARGKFDVTVKAEASHESKKQAELDTYKEMMQYTPMDTPMCQMISNLMIQSTTGQGGELVRKMARYQELQMAMQMGINPQPRNEEEEKYLQQLMQQMEQAQQQPDPQQQMMQAESEARLMEGQAAIMNEQNDHNKNEIEIQKLMLKDKELNIKAAESGVKVENTMADTIGKKIDNVMKLRGGE